VLGVALVTALGFIVMGLWNALIPSLFGGPLLRFWQALGLLVLSRILFGGFRGFRGHGGHGWRRRAMYDRWEKMTPEERERFRDGFKRWRHMGRTERAEFRRGFRGCGGGPVGEGPMGGGPTDDLGRPKEG
jgi:Ca2+/H+ antiporter, TMEM165/GDT1 family